MNELTPLDNEIDFAESEYVQARDSVLYKMAALGRLYSKKKAEPGYGGFIPWIEAREKLNRTEANRCMKVFNEFPEVLSNASHVTHLNQRTILAILYAPDEVKAEVKERLANGEDITAAEIKRLKLAKERPHLLIANRHSSADLDINSELMLLAFSADDQTKSVSHWCSG